MKIVSILIIFCTMVQAAVESKDCLTINNVVFKKDSSLISFDENKILKHMAIFDKIGTSFKSVLKKSNTNIQKNYVDTVFVSSTSPFTRYDNIKSNNIDMIRIDSNNIPVFISFIETQPSRHLTQEELAYYKEKWKIASSFCTISREEAIEKARSFLGTVLGESEKNKFDSVMVSEGGSTNADFVVKFYIKIRNDIWDSRRAIIVINANTGELQSYWGDSIYSLDYSYVPKITKNQALQMYIDECLKLKADVVTDMVVLNKYRNDGKSIWAWHIYGTRKDKKIRRAAAMFIDSETGEVLYKYLD